MSILNNDIAIEPTFVGHIYDVQFMTGALRDNNFPVFSMNGKWIKPDCSVLDGLLGRRSSKEAYVNQFKRYVIAAWMTCFVDAENNIYVPDDRFNRIIRMVNKMYGFPMGTLEVEFTTNPGVLRIWHKDMIYSGIGAFRANLKNPDNYRGVGFDPYDMDENMDHGYYAVKPQAIKTHMMAVERLLKYNVESNILEQ